MATGQSAKTAAIAVTAIFILLLQFPLRLGHVRLATFLTLLNLITLVTFLLWQGGGIHDFGSMLYPVIIACAGLLLRPKEFMAIVILSMLSAAAIILLEIGGVLTWSANPGTTFYTLLTVTAIFFLAAVPVRLMAGDLFRSMARARQSVHELAGSNAKLQQEISGHQRTEEALRESETRFRVLAESAFEGLCFSEEGVIIDANASLSHMLGLRPRSSSAARSAISWTRNRPSWSTSRCNPNPTLRSSTRSGSRTGRSSRSKPAARPSPTRGGGCG